MTRQPSSRIRPRKRLTADELLFQPWFLSWEIAQAIRVLIPPGYQRKMRDYFDAYGCMRCNRKDAVYQSNGMCKLCAGMIRIRLRKCIQRRLTGPGEIVPAHVFVGIPNRASQLLRGISRGERAMNRRPRNQNGPPNPALDAYKTLVEREPFLARTATKS